MHSAPAVRYPVARSSRVAVCLAIVWGVAGAACFGWWLRGGATAWQSGAAVAFWWVGAYAALVQWRGMPWGALRWDGQAWWWQAADEDERLVSIQVSVDLQRAVLLRVTGLPRHARWCYLAYTAQPARWADLRRALYSPQSSTSASRNDAVLPP